MPLRYLFGPVSKSFAEQNLAGVIAGGECVTFGPDKDATLRIRPGDSWEQVCGRLPDGWRPDFLALWLPYTTVPTCLWTAPVPKVGLAADAHLLWTRYQAALPYCDLVFADAPGAELLRQAGIGQARAGYLCEERKGVRLGFMGMNSGNSNSAGGRTGKEKT